MQIETAIKDLINIELICHKLALNVLFINAKSIINKRNLLLIHYCIEKEEKNMNNKYNSS